MKDSWGTAGRWPLYQAAHQSAKGRGAKPVQTPRRKCMKPTSTVALLQTRQGPLKIAIAVWTQLLTWRTVFLTFVNIKGTMDQCAMLWKCMPLHVRALESPSTPGEQKASVVSLNFFFFFLPVLLSLLFQNIFYLLPSFLSHLLIPSHSYGLSC